MFKEHTMRRAVNGYAQRLYSPAIIPTFVTLTSSTTLNILPIICWSIFGLSIIIGSVVLALHMFQRAEKNR